MSHKKATSLQKIYFQQLEQESMLQKISDTIEQIPHDSLLGWIQKENGQTASPAVALVLRLARPERAAALLKGLHKQPALQADLLATMAKQGNSHDHACESLLEVLEELIENSAKPSMRFGGQKKVTELLQGLTAIEREALLAKLAAVPQSAALAQTLRLSTVGLAQLALLMAKDLALLCTKLHDQTLANALFKEQQTVIQAFLQALPTARRSNVQELLNAFNTPCGPKLRRKEKNLAVAEVLAAAAQLKEQGKIIYPWEETLV